MDDFIGQIILTAWSTGSRTPRDFFPCDGRTLQIQQYQALYSLLGTQFGGDGRNTFAIPKLTAPAASNGGSMQYFICANGIYPNFQ